MGAPLGKEERSSVLRSALLWRGAHSSTQYITHYIAEEHTTVMSEGAQYCAEERTFVSRSAPLRGRAKLCAKDRNIVGRKERTIVWKSVPMYGGAHYCAEEHTIELRSALLCKGAKFCANARNIVLKSAHLYRGAHSSTE